MITFDTLLFIGITLFVLVIAWWSFVYNHSDESVLVKLCSTVGLWMVVLGLFFNKPSPLLPYPSALLWVGGGLLVISFLLLVQKHQARSHTVDEDEEAEEDEALATGMMMGAAMHDIHHPHHDQ